MALRKQVFDENEDEQPLKKAKRSRITIDVSPEMRRRIKMAAARNDLSISDYLGGVFEVNIPDEESVVQREGQPITQEAIERLRRIRKQILQDHQGKLFEDSTEMIRQMREERTQYLEQLREQR
jgi:uncharacterized protein (DUF1778 family)